MSNPVWPTHPDGSNKTMGEMTSEERRVQTDASLMRLRREMENPAMFDALIDAERRLRGAGMLGGDTDPINAAIKNAKRP